MKQIISLSFALCSLYASAQVAGTQIEDLPLQVKQTPYATYERYAQVYQGALLLDEQRVDIRKGERTIESISSLTTSELAALPASVDAEYLWFFNHSWHPVVPDTLLDGSQHEVIIRSLDGEELARRDLTAHANDTTVQVRVFSPDPLTPFGLSYGFPYTDQNDGNGAVLDTLSILDTVKVHQANDTTFLRNQFVELRDFDAPFIPISTDPSEWTGGRNADAFEQVMCLYHITRQNQYLRALGYSTLLTYAIPVDPQALNGQDNSMFNFGYTPPRLFFGEGGVDDAEDADVIIHELGHAMSHAAAPFTNVGTERRTFDEAVCDYFAERYGRRLGITSTRVFDWDGNNEYWPGRSVAYDGTKDYTTLTFSSIYSHTDLIASAMLELSAHPSTDPQTVDAMVIEVLHMLTPNATLRQISQNFHTADALITGGQYTAAIDQTFGGPKNLLGLEEDLPALTPPATLLWDGQSFYVQLAQSGNFEVRIYDTSGRLLQQLRPTTDRISLPSSGFAMVQVFQDGSIVATLKKP